MRAHTAVILASLLAAAAPCLAQSAQWSGPKTIGDINRENFVAGVLAARDARRATGQLSSEIARARREFFATRDDPKRRAAAEREFAEALRGKDMTYFAKMVPMGVKAVEMTQMLGGSIDGGIAEPLRPSFFAWVNDVRTTLGARTPDQALFLNDEQAFRRAFEASFPAYERYKTLRDRHEIETWYGNIATKTARAATREQVSGARAVDGSVKLHEQRIGKLDIMGDLRWDLLAPQLQLREMARQAVRDGQQVLACEYGPVAEYGDGKPRYELRRFWYRAAPARIDEMIAIDGRHALSLGPYSRLRTAKALDRCPPTNREAEAAVAANGSVTVRDAGLGHPVGVPPTPQQRAELQAASRAKFCESLAAEVRAEQARAQTAQPGSVAQLSAHRHAQRRADYHRRQCGS